MTDPKKNRIFEADYIVKSLRDSGYKTTYTALAELIDNSVQAGAKQVHVYFFSENVELPQRTVEQVVKIGVLDDGTGMDKDVLIKAIQFGNGTNLNGAKGLGKFGMGLPSSSISQCRSMHVWSWQNGVDKALSTNLNLDAILGGDFLVPEPTINAIDGDVNFFASKLLKRAGTLITWEELDKLSPKKFKTFHRNLEFVIGRIYRKQIFAGDVEIIAHDIVDKVERGHPTKIRANDPLYLMRPSCTPSPYDEKPLFIEYEHFQQPERVFSFAGKTGKVRIKVSMIAPGFRTKYLAENKHPAGSSDFGMHAAKNVGISVCREGRELNLDNDFADPSDPRDRWWGLEIDFDAALDELFELTFNKQEARAVNPFHSFDWKDDAQDGETQSSYLARIKEETPGREQLVKLFSDIETCLAAIRSEIKLDGAKAAGPVRPKADIAEAIATEVAEEREKVGQEGGAFREELPTTVELDKELLAEGIPVDAMEHLKDIVLKKNRFGIEVGRNEESQSFFQVKLAKGMLVVVINSAHPFYSEMWEPMFGEDSTNTAMSAEEKISRAEVAFKLTLLAWARLEDETRNEGERMRLIRADWGRLLRDFLKDLKVAGRPQDLID